MASSSFSRQVSTSSVRYFSTSARICRSLGVVMCSLSARSGVTSRTCHSASLSSESQTSAFISTRSTMPLKLSSEPIGNLHRQRARAEALLDHVDAAQEIRAAAVHLVDVANARHVVVVREAPVGLRLRLDAGDAVEHHHRAVEHAQRAVHLDGEVDVSRGVDQVDLLVAPEGGHRGALNRDAALLLLLEVVRRRRRLQILGVVDVDDRVLAPRVIQDALGRRRFAGVDVGDDADIADIGKGGRTGHSKFRKRVKGMGRKGPRQTAHSDTVAYPCRDKDRLSAVSGRCNRTDYIRLCSRVRRRSKSFRQPRSGDRGLRLRLCDFADYRDTAAFARCDREFAADRTRAKLHGAHAESAARYAGPPISPRRRR